jgi:hypothetical protein
VVGEEAHDDGIADEGALHTTAFDRDVDTDDPSRARVHKARMRRWN